MAMAKKIHPLRPGTLRALGRSATRNAQNKKISNTVESNKKAPALTRSAPHSWSTRYAGRSKPRAGDPRQSRPAKPVAVKSPKQIPPVRSNEPNTRKKEKPLPQTQERRPRAPIRCGFKENVLALTRSPPPGYRQLAKVITTREE